MDWLGWGMEDMARWGQFCLLTNSGWEFQVGGAEHKSSKAGGQGAWLEVSEEKNLTREQGFSQQLPICSLFCSPHYSQIPTRKTFTP